MSFRSGSWFSELTFGVLLVCRAAKRRPKEAEPEQVAPETPEDRDEDERVSALPLLFLTFSLGKDWMCMSVLPACMFVYHICAVPTEDGVRWPGTGCGG